MILHPTGTSGNIANSFQKYPCCSKSFVGEVNHHHHYHHYCYHFHVLKTNKALQSNSMQKFLYPFWNCEITVLTVAPLQT